MDQRVICGANARSVIMAAGEGGGGGGGSYRGWGVSSRRRRLLSGLEAEMKQIEIEVCFGGVR